MTQPSFVPIAGVDQVRPARRLEIPAAWTPDRPADLRSPGQPTGPRLGRPGPDQGYALRLARRLEHDLSLAQGESAEDVVTGCALIASKRAALFGRAPVIHDVRVAALIWGFLGWDGQSPPEDLVELRRRAFRSVGHEYERQRQLADAVPDEVLRLAPEEVGRRAQAEWRDWLVAGGGPASGGQ